MNEKRGTRTASGVSYRPECRLGLNPTFRGLANVAVARFVPGGQNLTEIATYGIPGNTMKLPGAFQNATSVESFSP